MLDHVLMILEIILLGWVVVQGEYVRFYEREVHRMTRERFEERAKWRKEKQEQTRRKIAQKTSDSSANTVSALPDKTNFESSKEIVAKSAE